MSLLAFPILPCVFPFITSPVTDPLVSVPEYIVFVLLHVFVGLFRDILRDVSLLLGLGLPLPCCHPAFCCSVPQVSPHVSPWYVSGFSFSCFFIYFVLFATLAFVLLTHFWFFWFPWSYGFVCTSTLIKLAFCYPISCLLYVSAFGSSSFPFKCNSHW